MGEISLTAGRIGLHGDRQSTQRFNVVSIHIEDDCGPA